MTDRFYTVAGENRVRIAVGACRFIASVARTNTEIDARDYIARVSGEFRDATHNAYAYKIGVDDLAISRQNDAAEPAGTAGPPMLQAIENAGLTNITVVGTRYFGGVKLGIGGLIRAYRACAEAGLQEARRVTEVFFAPYRVIISYGQLGTVLREAAAFGKVDDVQYGAEQVTVCCSIPLSVSAPFKKQLLDVTGGKAEVEKAE